MNFNLFMFWSIQLSTEALIVAICGLGLGYSCWKAGLKSGAERTIEILHQKRINCYDNKGDVKPNQFWQEENKDEE